MYQRWRVYGTFFTGLLIDLFFAPMKLLNTVLNRIESIDISLDQTLPCSDFLVELASNSAPGVPYTTVAKNTSPSPEDKNADLKQRLVKNLGKAVDLPFIGKTNDIAVLGDRIVSIPKRCKPEPKIIPAACNHLVYFTDPVGLEALTDAVVGTGVANVRAQVTTRTMETNTSETVASPSTDEVKEPSRVDIGSDSSVETASASASTSVQQIEKAAGKIMPWLIGLAFILVGGLVSFGLMKRSESGSRQTSFDQLDFERIEQRLEQRG